VRLWNLHGWMKGKKKKKKARLALTLIDIQNIKMLYIILLKSFKDDTSVYIQ